MKDIKNLQGTKKSHRSLLDNEKFLGYLLLIPGFTLLFFIIFYPISRGIWYSFTNANLLKPGKEEFVGFLNYIKLLGDPLILLSLQNSLIYVVGTVSLGFFLGLVLASLLNQNIRFRSLFRGIALCPWVIPSVVAAISWEWLYSREYGAINATLLSLGLIREPISWLGPELAMLSVIITAVWKTLPFHTVMLLAGLQAIPTHLYEAAEVDGANKLQRFLYVTLPNLKFVVMVDTTIQAIWAFKELTMIYIMTHGGPVYATEVFSLHIYRTAFEVFDIGFATSQATLMLLMLLAFAIIYAKTLRVD